MTTSVINELVGEVWFPQPQTRQTYSNILRICFILPALKRKSPLFASFKIIDRDVTKLGAFQAGLKQLLTYLLWAADLLKNHSSSLNSPRFCLWS